jgi:predicted ATPase
VIWPFSWLRDATALPLRYLAIQGMHLALTSDLNSVSMIASARTAFRSTGTNSFAPLDLSILASTYAVLEKFDDAWRCMDEAMTGVETTNERGWDAEIHRMPGEIVLMSPEVDAAKAEAYFQRALAVARQQQAKSWEVRATMSMARLWRDQGKRDEAAIFSLRSMAGLPKASIPSI